MAKPAQATTDDLVHVSLFGAAHSRGGRPGAAPMLQTERTKVVVFEFAAGDDFPDHAAHHPTLIQVLRGRATFIIDGTSYDLTPGELLHVPPLAKHSVHAVEPTTLTVTMLLAQD